MRVAFAKGMDADQRVLASFASELESFIDIVRTDALVRQSSQTVELQTSTMQKEYDQQEKKTWGIVSNKRSQDLGSGVDEIKKERDVLQSRFDALKGEYAILETKHEWLKTHEAEVIAAYEKQFKEYQAQSNQANGSECSTPKQQVAESCSVRLEKLGLEMAALEAQYDKLVAEVKKAKQADQDTKKFVLVWKERLHSCVTVINMLREQLEQVRSERNMLLAEQRHLRAEALTATVTLKSLLP